MMNSFYRQNDSYLPRTNGTRVDKEGAMDRMQELGSERGEFGATDTDFGCI